MSNTKNALREKIIAQPELVIEDHEVMRALMEATDQRMGDNVLDMRSLAIQRMEERIARLEDVHHAVIAAAYDNQASTGQIHRAVLCLLEAQSLGEFVQILTGDVCAILQVDVVQLILETETRDARTLPHGDGIVFADPGVVAAYLTGSTEHPSRQITLRQIDIGERRVYGQIGDTLRSEACLLLEFGTGRAPGLLLMGSENPQKFTPQMGTDLLAFLAQVIEECLKRLTP